MPRYGPTQPRQTLHSRKLRLSTRMLWSCRYCPELPCEYSYSRTSEPDNHLSDTHWDGHDAAVHPFDQHDAGKESV